MDFFYSVVQLHFTIGRPKEISDILDRLSAIISASYTRPIGDTEDEEAKSA